MDVELSKLKQDNTIKEALEIIENSHYNILPIINHKEKIIGSITRNEIETAILQGTCENTAVEKIMNPEPRTIKQDDDLYKAFYILHLDDEENLLVIDNSKKVTGILTREKVLTPIH